MGLARERQGAGEHLVEHHPEGVQVRGGTDLLAHGLLGGHVLRGPEDLPRIGDPIRLPGLDEARRTEVQHLGQDPVLAGQEHDVARLHVPMDDAVAVGLLEGAADVRRDEAGLVGLQGRMVLDRVGEEVAPGQLHGEVEEALPGQTEVVDDRAESAPQHAGRAGLTDEALDAGRVLEEFAVEDLEGHLPLDGHLAGPIDHAHAAATEEIEDHVLPVDEAALQAPLGVPEPDELDLMFGACERWEGVGLEALRTEPVILCFQRRHSSIDFQVIPILNLHESEVTGKAHGGDQQGDRI